MGMQSHVGIVVTSYNDEAITDVWIDATEIFYEVSDILDSKMNGVKSFFIPPSGSNVGREQAKKHEKDCQTFKEILKKYPSLSWVQIQYGDENHDNKILECS